MKTQSLIIKKQSIKNFSQKNILKNKNNKIKLIKIL